uniref:Nip2b n=1 Tax=Arundo donax TaxID=35708 RepID=A0A0A9EGB3_ARUDO
MYRYIPAGVYLRVCIFSPVAYVPTYVRTYASLISGAVYVCVIISSWL